MAQQDVRYYMNGLLSSGRESLRAVATMGIGWTVRNELKQGENGGRGHRAGKAFLSCSDIMGTRERSSWRSVRITFAPDRRHSLYFEAIDGVFRRWTGIRLILRKRCGGSERSEGLQRTRSVERKYREFG